MERKFKTGASNRENYVYYTANGSKIIIEPGKDGVDEEWIKKLHELDDKEQLQNRREEYETPNRIGKLFGDEHENDYAKNPLLVDDSADPLESILKSVAEEEHLEKIKNLRKILDELDPVQKRTVYKKFYLGMSNVAIALEEGLTEGSIRKRLKKIYAIISKKIKNF